MPLFLRCMLKKQTQRKLALYFSAMIFLNGLFFWRSAHGIATGLSDFSSFYTAAEILHEGRGHQLYNLDLQEAVQRSVTPAGVNERGAVIPYNHPPFEAPLFLPLIAFPYGVAYSIWLVINAGLLAAVIIILRKHLPYLGRLPLYLWIAACLAFTPITFALIQGQDSIVVLFCFCMAFIALRRKTEFSAGMWVALGLFRFQLSLPLIAPSLLLKRWRTVGGFCVVGLLLALISLGTVGLANSWHYPEFVWKLHHNPKFSWLAPIGSPNLHGLVSVLSLPNYPRLGTAFLLIISGILLAVATVVWRTVPDGDPRHLDLAFSSTLFISVLLSYHILVHDLSVLFLAFLLALENTIAGRTASLWSKHFILWCSLILWSPLVLILFEEHQLELLAIIYFVLLGSLLFENRLISSVVTVKNDH